MSILAAVQRAAQRDERSFAISAAGEISAQQTLEHSQLLADALATLGTRRIASLLDNGPQWLNLDLAIARLQLVHVPLPAFFHPSQMLHALTAAGVDCLVSDQDLSQFGTPTELAGSTLKAWAIPVKKHVPLPEQTALITFTSGTTGAPKGVCLAQAQLEQVAASLHQISRQTEATRHVCLLPLGVLLEQVAGMHAALLADAQICLPSLRETGISGASGVDGDALCRCIRNYQAHSAIMLQQMLDALCAAIERGAPRPEQLRFLAVGGSRVSPSAIQRALDLGLPVYQGYGLSETGSVLCLETPTMRRAGSVGKPLPSRQVRVDEKKQVWVDTPGFLGYLGEQPFLAHSYPTGDLGHFDDDGFLHLHGRQSNVLITAMGRNVSPEWVESELIAHPLIAQAFVCGDAEAWLQAVLVPADANATELDLERAVISVNRQLPDYARIGGFIQSQPFTQVEDLLTSNGRLKRAPLLALYGDRLEPLWDREQSALRASSVGDATLTPVRN